MKIENALKKLSKIAVIEKTVYGYKAVVRGITIEFRAQDGKAIGWGIGDYPFDNLSHCLNYIDCANPA